MGKDDDNRKFECQFDHKSSEFNDARRMNAIVFGTCKRTLTSPETPMPETPRPGTQKPKIPKPEILVTGICSTQLDLPCCSALNRDYRLVTENGYDVSDVDMNTCQPDGYFNSKQCNDEFCWCVNKDDGEFINGSMTLRYKGDVDCSAFGIQGRGRWRAIKKCLKENLPKPWGEIKNATKEITWECPPKCKPPAEKMPEIQAALVAASGQEIANKIKATFEQCKEQSQGRGAMKQCLRDNLPKPYGEIREATRGITWECPVRLGRPDGRQDGAPASKEAVEKQGRGGCEPPPEKIPEIRAAFVAAFGQDDANSIFAAFDQCKEQTKAITSPPEETRMPNGPVTGNPTDASQRETQTTSTTVPTTTTDFPGCQDKRCLCTTDDDCSANSYLTRCSNGICRNPEERHCSDVRDGESVEGCLCSMDSDCYKNAWDLNYECKSMYDYKSQNERRMKYLPERICQPRESQTPWPDTPRPDTPWPDTPRPDTPWPDTPRPETPMPETPMPETPRLETPRPETPRPYTPKPETPRPDTPRPGTPWPDTLRPETPRPETPRPETPKPQTPKQETPEPETPKPETPKQETPEPETPRPGTPKPQTPKPKTPRPETPEPETPRPETPKPETPEPESRQLPEIEQFTPICHLAGCECRTDDHCNGSAHQLTCENNICTCTKLFCSCETNEDCSSPFQCNKFQKDVMRCLHPAHSSKFGRAMKNIVA